MADVHATFQLAESAPDTLQVSGALTFATAADALSAINAAVARNGRRQIDLAGVQHSDSAGLACVLAVLSEAAKQGCKLALRNVPEGMRVLAQVCEVDALIA
ncbi:STAS domain-containing protein [Dyella subtropica]|uniref:STAS domain-containing protein n=1 Tax=Dyella subtropica TaxID=2992127 RepID=UPI0022560BB7|nr:STAS domain-containing protein [Dyella subtropica]